MSDVRPLSDVAEINPSMPRSLRQQDGDDLVPFLAMSAVSQDGTASYDERRSLGSVLQGYTYFGRGDVLLAKITPCFENGKAAHLADLPGDIGFGSTEFHVVRRGPALDGRYLFHAIWNPSFRKRGQRFMTGTAGQKRLPAEFLRSYRLPVPPLAEQKRIATVLDEADGIRRKRRESLRLLDEFLRSAFLEMFGDPVRNEKGWDVAPLEDLIDPARPITYGILKPGPDTPGGVPYVRVVDMANGTVKRTGVKRTTRAIAEAYRRSVLRAGDLLLSIRGHVGRIAAVPGELEAANITQDTARLAVLPRYSREYVGACLTSSPMQNLMRRYVRGVAVTGINLGDVKKLPVPTPPLELQQRFTSVALRHSSLTARAHEAQETTRQLFDSLAQRAFRGQGH